VGWAERSEAHQQGFRLISVGSALRALAHPTLAIYRSGIDRHVGKVTQMWSSVRFWFVLNTLALIALLVVQFTFGSELRKAEWWPDLFGILTSILTGGIISFLFYFLVRHLRHAEISFAPRGRARRAR
jgi:hypothetical protein